MTPTEVKDALRRGESFDCPCCGQRAKAYKRKITGFMARFLQRLSEYPSWVRVRDWPGMTGGEHAKLALWGLIEEQGHNFTWRITPLGRQFLAGQVYLPRFLFTFNNEVIATSDERVKFAHCLGERFDYEEMVSA